MPRTLKDLSNDERKALLNRVWDNMVATEIASSVGANEEMASPLGKAGAVPADLADHIRPFVSADGGALADWKILNASCAVPDATSRIGRFQR
jgi:hypothetical protein